MRCPIILLAFFCSLYGFGQNKYLTISPTISVQDTVSVRKLLDLAHQYTVNDPEKAKAYLIQAIDQAKQQGYPVLEVDGLYKLGAIHINQGKRNTAKPLFEQGLKLAQKLNNAPLIAQGHYNLSRYYDVGNDFDLAMGHLEKSLNNFEELELPKNIANCHTSFGRIYQKMGSYDKSLSHCFKALRINESIDNSSGISVVKTTIGYTYVLTSKFEDAMLYFNEALEIDKINNDQVGILISMLNIGVVYQKTERHPKALKTYKEALIIAKQLNYYEEEAILLENIGSTLRDMGHFESGLKSLFAASVLEDKNNLNKAHTLNDIAETYLALNKPKKATEYALQAISYSKEKNELNQLRYAYSYLALAYKKQGKNLEAFNALEASYEIKDSLFNLDKAKQMDLLHLSYQTEKKEQEILTLRQEQEITRFRRNTYLLAGILLISILLLLYNRQRLKSKKNHELFEKEQEVTLLKSQFFENVSHEFRTPLTLILGPMQLLKSNIADSKMSRQLGIMERNAQRLLSLINKLLDFSKIESGEDTLEITKSDIVSVVKGVTMSFQSKADEKHLKLEVSSNLNAHYTCFDLEKLETILINLISNAFKFTPENGHVKVSLEILENNQQKEHCKIIVTDTGQGITDTDIKNIFNRFYQSTNPRDGKYDGSGIGLALTQELVKLHKGSIEAVSKEDQGTSITVLLPIGKSHFNEIELANKNGTVLEESQPINDSISEVNPPIIANTNLPILLLVEDNVDVMHYLKEILEDRYQILEASDGAMGIEMAFETIPDLIVSDVMMPKKNGYEVCETLKQDERTSHISIILLTAKASEEDKMQGLLTKADAYLTKPFAPKELLVRVQNLIESRKKLREKYKRELILKPSEVSVNSIDENFLLKVIKVVNENLDDEHFNMDKLGQGVGMSRSQIHRKLQALTNQSATQFIRSYRLDRAIDLIKKDAKSISEIAYSVGFSDPSYFSKCFQQQFNMTPTEAKDTPS